MLHGVFCFVHDFLQLLLEGFRVFFFQDPFEDLFFHDAPEIAAFHQEALVHEHHLGAGFGSHGKQIFVFQDAEGFPDGAAAHLEIILQQGFTDDFPRPERNPDDAFPEAPIYVIAVGFSLQPGHLIDFHPTSPAFSFFLFFCFCAWLLSLFFEKSLISRDWCQPSLLHFIRND